MEQDIKTVRKHFRGTDLMEDLQANDPEKAPPLTNKDISIFDKRLSLVANMDPQLGTRVGVHLGLFGNASRVMVPMGRFVTGYRKEVPL